MRSPRWTGWFAAGGLVMMLLGLVVLAHRTDEHPRTPGLGPPTVDGAAMHTADGPEIASADAAGDAVMTLASGRVTDRQGRGIEGARLTLAAQGGPTERAREQTLSTDAQGRFSLESTFTGEHAVTISAPGYVTQRLRWRLPTEAAPTVVLIRAARIRGRIVDPAGQALDRVVLELLLADGEALVPLDPRGSSTLQRLKPIGELGVLPGPIPFPPIAGQLPQQAHAITTDTAGNYAIEGLSPGRLVVVARHPDWVEARSQMVELAEGQEVAVHLTMQAGLALRGRVVDERGAVANAELWHNGALRTITTSDGRFELGRVAGPIDVEVRARGHTPARRTLDPAGGEVEVRMSSAGDRVTGVVRDERGFAVRGVTLELRAASGNTQQVQSDARGEFSFDSAPRGASLLIARATRYPEARVNVTAGDDVQISLQPGGAVAGEVHESQGRSLPRDLAVTIEDERGTRQRVELDPGGRFTCYGLAPGDGTLRAQAPGYAPVALSLFIPLGSTPSEITLRDLRVELAAAGVVVGRIGDRYGAPVADRMVEGGGIRTRSDSNGQFRLVPLRAGRVRVQVEGTALVREIEVVAGTETRVDITLP